MSKRLIREQLRERIAGIDNKPALSQKICKKVEELELNFNSVLLYKALPSEVNVDSLIEKYMKGKHVYLPKVVGDDMYLVKIDKNTTYNVGAFNIKEPVGELLSPENVNIDLCITPLLGFDINLNRLGKGKGYYDRFFAKCGPKLKLGVAFSNQMFDGDIETEAHDVKLDIIVTEDKVYENNSRKV